jgi:hypothetical protein
LYILFIDDEQKVLGFCIKEGKNPFYRIRKQNDPKKKGWRDYYYVINTQLCYSGGACREVLGGTKHKNLLFGGQIAQIFLY